MHQAPGGDDSDENYLEFSNQEEMKQQQDVPQSFNTIKTTDMVHPSNIIDQKGYRHQQDEEVIPLDQPSMMMADEEQPPMIVPYQQQKRPMVFNSKGAVKQNGVGFDIEDATRKLKEIEAQENKLKQISSPAKATEA